MLETILIIVICAILLSSIGDLFFKFIGFAAKIVLSIVLILACIFLLIKTTIIIVPWILYICLIVGIFWLISTIFFRK